MFQKLTQVSLAFCLLGASVLPATLSAQSTDFHPSIDLGSFTFHGYARAGISDSYKGGQAGCYGNATIGHYTGRIGDECDSYIELALGKEGNDGPNKHWEINSMISILTNPGAQYNDYQSVTDPGLYTSEGDIALRQINVIGKGYLSFAPEAAIWAGKRYYKRRYDQLLDLYYLNDSGYGGGIEDIKTPIGKASIAWIAASQPPFTGKTNAEGEEAVQINRWDIRLEEIKIAPKLTLSLSGLFLNGTLTPLQQLAKEPNAGGLLATTELTYRPRGGEHTLVGQFGQHSGANLAYLNQSGAAQDPLNASYDGDLRHAGRFLAIGKQDIFRRANIGYSVLFTRGITLGTASVSKTTPYTFSAVLSPSFRESKYFTTRFEAGFDKIQAASQPVGHGLQKVMIAEEFRPIVGYDVAIRAYSGAFFGKDARENKAVNSTGDSANLRTGIQLTATW